MVGYMFGSFSFISGVMLSFIISLNLSYNFSLARALRRKK
jgi:hypothetical protein